MVFRQVISSRQNITDLLRSNAYIVFFVMLVLFSEAWWGLRIPFSWRIHGAGLVLTVSLFSLLYLIRHHFRHYAHWMDAGWETADKIVLACSERGFYVVRKGERYSDDNKLGFAYLEDLMEIKLKC